MAPSSSERHQGRAARAAEGLQRPLAQAPTASGHPRRLPPSRRLAGRAQLVLLLDTETMAACAAVGRAAAPQSQWPFTPRLALPALAIGTWRMLLAAASLRWTKARRLSD